jgi:hypothetical protein
MSSEKFMKHMNQPIVVKFKDNEGNEDEFKFKPLNVFQFTTLMVLGEKMEKLGTKNEPLDRETIPSMS